MFRPSSISLPSMPRDRSLPRMVSHLSSRVQEPIFSVVLPELVCSQSMTKSNCSCSERPSRVDLVKKKKQRHIVLAIDPSNLTRASIRYVKKTVVIWLGKDHRGEGSIRR